MLDVSWILRVNGTHYGLNKLEYGEEHGNEPQQLYPRIFHEFIYSIPDVCVSGLDLPILQLVIHAFEPIHLAHGRFVQLDVFLIFECFNLFKAG